MATRSGSESPFRSWHLWYGGLMALAGIGLSLFGSLHLWKTHRFLASAVHAQATVVDYKIWPAEKRHRELYQPIVRFVDPAGRSWEKKVGTSELHRVYPIGQHIAIVYESDHPGQFLLNTWSDIWLTGWLFVGIGALALFLGLIMSAYVRGKLRHPDEAALKWWDRWFAPLKLLLRAIGG